MTVTISYGVDTEPETLENVDDITWFKDSKGTAIIITFYDKFDHMRYRIIRYTEYVTITIH